MAAPIPIDHVCPHTVCPIGMEGKSAAQEQRLDDFETRIAGTEKQTDKLSSKLDTVIFMVMGTLLTAAAGLVAQLIIAAASRR